MTGLLLTHYSLIADSKPILIMEIDRRVFMSKVRPALYGVFRDPFTAMSTYIDYLIEQNPYDDIDRRLLTHNTKESYLLSIRHYLLSIASINPESVDTPP